MMTTAPIRLSKSKLASYEHCAKRLWLQVHRRAEAQFDESTLTRFQFGHDVGRRARFLVPNGVLVETGFDMAAAIAQTASLLAEPEPSPIFEATFQYQNVLVRIDILQPDAGGWHLVEVKGSAHVGSHHLSDVATQAWVARGSGVEVSKVSIRHLAHRIDWRRPDIGGVKFKDTDVTSQLYRFLVDRSRLAKNAALTLAGPEPHRAVGPYCYRPLACEFRQRCCAALPSL